MIYNIIMLETILYLIFQHVNTFILNLYSISEYMNNFVATEVAIFDLKSKHTESLLFDLISDILKIFSRKYITKKFYRK